MPTASPVARGGSKAIMRVLNWTADYKYKCIYKNKYIQYYQYVC